jgi:hypothetical protein
MSNPDPDKRFPPGLILLLWLTAFLFAATFGAQLAILWSK